MFIDIQALSSCNEAVAGLTGEGWGGGWGGCR